jgi:uncharacterized protein
VGPEASDGKTPGYPVVIFGGSHADVPIEEGSGTRLAEIVAGGTFSCLIDTSMMTVGARPRFFTDFAEALLRNNARPLHLIINEAHLFAPQRRVPDPQSGRMVHAANNLVSGGRVRGLRVMLISQRPAKLHKNSLTQFETLIAMRLIAPQDRAAVEDWIGEWAEPKQGREIIASLPSLPRGTGWVWAPELDVPAKMDFPRIKTFDSSSTPEDGEPVTAPADLSAIDIAALRDALAVAETGVSAVPKAAVPSRAQLEAAAKRGYERGLAEGRAQGLQEVIAAITPLLGPPEPAMPPTPSPPPRAPRKAPEAPSERTSRGQPELRILRVLAAHHPARFTWAQWATLSHMKRTGGTWQTYVSRLRTAGYLDEDGSTIGITPVGLNAAGQVDRPASGTVSANGNRPSAPGRPR